MAEPGSRRPTAPVRPPWCCWAWPAGRSGGARRHQGRGPRTATAETRVPPTGISSSRLRRPGAAGHRPRPGRAGRVGGAAGDPGPHPGAWPAGWPCSPPVRLLVTTGLGPVVGDRLARAAVAAGRAATSRRWTSPAGTGSALVAAAGCLATTLAGRALAAAALARDGQPVRRPGGRPASHRRRAGAPPTSICGRRWTRVATRRAAIDEYTGHQHRPTRSRAQEWPACPQTTATPPQPGRPPRWRWWVS